MQNWDEREEVGNDNCSVERDRADAAAAARQLGIPLHHADFVAQYWTSVRALPRFPCLWLFWDSGGGA